jgi:hypothetical protein
MNTCTRLLGSHFASYLINNDSSSLDPREVSDLKRWLAQQGLKPEDCIDAEDSGFSWIPDFGLSNNCMTYTFEIKK